MDEESLVGKYSFSFDKEDLEGDQPYDTEEVALCTAWLRLVEDAVHHTKLSSFCALVQEEEGSIYLGRFRKIREEELFKEPLLTLSDISEVVYDAYGDAVGDWLEDDDGGLTASEEEDEDFQKTIREAATKWFIENGKAPQWEVFEVEKEVRLSEVTWDHLGFKLLNMDGDEDGWPQKLQHDGFARSISCQVVLSSPPVYLVCKKDMYWVRDSDPILASALMALANVVMVDMPIKM